MNDTMNLWHNVWGCSSKSGKVVEYDFYNAIIIPTCLVLLTAVFYIGSYNQSDQKLRRLVQCMIKIKF